jgi:hypothetical protein
MMLITLVAMLLAFTIDSTPPRMQASGGAGKVTVYRSQTCGCCGKWVEHLQKAGFAVTVHIVDRVDNAPGRDRVPAELRSCHIANVNRYLIEGHVPADVIKDLLRKRPKIEGLAVPGMPAGSPGMESPQPVPYDIVSWDRSGKTATFAKR